MGLPRLPLSTGNDGVASRLAFEVRASNWPSGAEFYLGTPRDQPIESC